MPAVPPGIPTSNLVLFLQTQFSPPLYNAIANLGDFTNSQSTTTVDVSKHGDKFRAFVATLEDGGTWTFPCWFVPTEPTLAGNPKALSELQHSRSLETWLVAFVDDLGVIVPVTGAQCWFNAYVTKFGLKAPVAGVYSADTELRTTGAINYLFPTTSMPAGQTGPATT